MNTVNLIGRMTRDPELRRTNTGAAVTSFTLALNRNYNSADGQQADYINCVVWNKVAENVEKYCSKGSLVGVEGRLRSRSYDNAQGQKVYVVEVVCSSVQFLETKKKENSQFNDSVDDGSFYENPPMNIEKDDFNSFNIAEDDIQF